MNFKILLRVILSRLLFCLFRGVWYIPMILQDAKSARQIVPDKAS
jgi:hypothetical protein